MEDGYDDDDVECDVKDSHGAELLRDTLLEYDHTVVLEGLILSHIIDKDTGKLTDWWMNLLNPDLVDQYRKNDQEVKLLSDFAKLLFKKGKEKK